MNGGIEKCCAVMVRKHLNCYILAVQNAFLEDSAKFDYMSVAYNNPTLADSNKLEDIQRKFAILCYNQSNSVCYYE
jgi:hypothetical protein